MKRIQVPPLTEEQLTRLEGLYQKTDKPRYRTRAQMVLLSAEKGLKAEEIAGIVRQSHITVLRWMKRYLAEGVEGLKDDPRPGTSLTVTDSSIFKLKAAGRSIEIKLAIAGRHNVYNALAASAAAFSGLRAICAMKQNGMNVASDYLLTLNLVGVKSGLVLVACEDPQGHSSNNEQDSRFFAKMAASPSWSLPPSRNPRR